MEDLEQALQLLLRENNTNFDSQLAGYLDSQHLDKGFLVIFEHRTAKTWR